jgi:SAM-dependent methyltransferase
MDTREQQLQIIRERYAKPNFNVVHSAARDVLERRLARVAAPSDFRGKRVLEIGAGCSTYLQLFLDHGCSELVANDLIPERLKLNAISDPRYSAVEGDLLRIDLGEESFDIVFANLTLMFLVPILGEVFTRLNRILKPGGLLLSIDPNYLCPLSVYRRFADRSGANPARIFNPFSFERAVRRAGFNVQKMSPFTGDVSYANGNWLLSTCFAMRSEKPLVR